MNSMKRPIKKTQPKHIIFNKLKSKDITLFTRQLATLLKAGIPLVDALGILTKSLSQITMSRLLKQIRSDLESGVPLSRAFAKYPQHFDNLYCALIAAGEQSGTLIVMLERLAYYKEKMASLRQKVQKALFYPAFVIAVALIVTIILLLWIVPQFEKLFNEFGAQLPVFTQLILSLSQSLQNHGASLLFIFPLIFIIKTIKNHNLRFRIFLDRVLLKVFIVGNVLYQSALARFCRTLATTFAVGVPLPEGLHSAAKAVDNTFLYLAIEKIIVDIKMGRQLQFAMQSVNIFPILMIQMIAVGEEAGRLDEMLNRIADFYDEAVDNKIATLSSLLEPIIMVILGVLIGSLIIAIYLPIFNMGQVVG